MLSLRAVLLATFLLGGLGSASAAPPSPPPGGATVRYSGRLADAQGRPIAGIYPLTFNLYKGEKGGKAAWSETHYVAVDDGAYAVELGDQKPLPKSVKVDEAWVGVALSGGREIVRERLVGGGAGPASAAAPAAASPAVAPPSPTPAAPPTTVVGAPPTKSDQSYVERAGYAYESEHAKSAASLGGVSAAELKALVRAQANPSKAKVGSGQRLSDKVGGQGGEPYSQQCPPGYVVTGLQGTYESYVNSITLICSPLE